MSREMYTSVTIEGTPDQLFAMLKTLQSFETDWQEQYWELAHSKQVGAELDHGYLERVETCGCFLKDMTDEALRSLAEKSPRGCTIRADGPMGSFMSLEKSVCSKSLPRPLLMPPSPVQSRALHGVLNSVKPPS